MNHEEPFKCQYYNTAYTFREGRYLLILTENFAALPRVKQLLLEDGKEEPYVIFGSSFPKDQLFTQVTVVFFIINCQVRTASDEIC